MRNNSSAEATQQLGATDAAGVEETLPLGVTAADDAQPPGAIAASATRKNKCLRRLDDSAPSPRDAVPKKYQKREDSVELNSMERGLEIIIAITLAAGDPVNLTVELHCKVRKVIQLAEQSFGRRISRLVTQHGEILPVGNILSRERIRDGVILTAIAASNLRILSSRSAFAFLTSDGSVVT